MDITYISMAIITMVIVNALTRALPFLFFGKTNPPAFILFIEKSFPPIMMTILVFYSLKGIDVSTAPFGLYEISATAVTIILHLWFKNYLLSIFGSTVFYMSLIQGWIF